MAINTLNPTGRKHILLEHLNISLHSDDFTFFTKPDLRNYDFPDNAVIRTEVWVKGLKNTVLLHEWGPVSNPNPYPQSIEELQFANNFSCNFKVVDAFSYVILGLHEGIELTRGPIDSTSSNKGFIDIIEADLKDLSWDLKFNGGDDDRPQLYIHEGKSDLLTNPIFLEAALPAYVRLILLRMAELRKEGITENAWIEDWASFIENTLGVESTPQIDEGQSFSEYLKTRNIWVEEVVQSFATAQQALMKQRGI